MNDEPLEDLPIANRDARSWSWPRSPRLFAAAACFVLGALMLLAGLIPRLVPSQPSVAALDPLVALETAELSDLAVADDRPTELIVYISGAVIAPDVYRLPNGARVKDAVVAAGGLRPDAAAEQINLAEPLGDAQHIHVPPQSPAGPASSAPADQRLDLNRASPADLEELPGVGTVLAERIVAHRTEQGPFSTLEELREVTGIGTRLFAQIAPLLRVGP